MITNGQVRVGSSARTAADAVEKDKMGRSESVSHAMLSTRMQTTDGASTSQGTKRQISPTKFPVGMLVSADPASTRNLKNRRFIVKPKSRQYTAPSEQK